MRKVTVMYRKLCLASAAIGCLGATTAAAQDGLIGTWQDPKDSVHVRTQPCGEAICGVVVWATDQAKERARRAGTQQLIGTTVFRDFHQQKANQWRGRVFVPDQNTTFSGTITLVDPNTIRGTGCLLGRIICKSRTWHRVP